MAIRRSSGSSPFDRIRSHYDEDLRCRECGYEDTDGEWRATTTGSRVDYTHVCPSCGAVEQRTLKLR
jgi:hypothetical protein